MLRRNKVLLTLAVIAVALIAIRAALPGIAKGYVNRTLASLQAYEGSIDDIDLALLRGAYRIDGIRIVKRGTNEPKPFFSCGQVDLSVEWRSLLKGSIVSQVVFIRPEMNLVQEKTKERSQLGEEEAWQARLHQLFPFRFNTIEVRDGRVTFRAPGIRTQDALVAQHVDGRIENLTNVADANEETFASFDFRAAVLGDSPAHINGRIDPLAKQPTFKVSLEVRQVPLPKLNPWLRHYIKADAQSGTFELFMELAAADGAFKGYAKPIMQDVKMAASEEPGLLRKLWEGVLEFATKVFENKPEQQVAARVPFSGTIKQPKAGVWPTMISVVSNAFVGAFAHSLEGSISIRGVKESLGKYSEHSPQEGNKESKKDGNDAEGRKDESKK